MSSPTTRKPLLNTSNSATRTRQSENNHTTPILSSTGQGIARTSSFRSSRPVRRPLGRQSNSYELEDDADEAKAMNAQLIAELREQVERTEQASEQYRKQLEMMQKRLEEAADEQTATEEREFATRTLIDQLQAEIKDNIRQQREMEMNYNSEINMLLQDRERHTQREAELQSIINRLNETIKSKSLERASDQQSTSYPDQNESLSEAQGTGQDYMQIMQARNHTIESLRLELADAQIKLAEQEHVENGELQALEKDLRDVKMQNARLLEENDSFQMLLGEKTLKGDFPHDQTGEMPIMTSLADELEIAGEGTEVSLEVLKKVEADLKASREEKKALTLYIDKIIGRLLQHEGFEHIITGKEDTENEDVPPLPSRSIPVNKALPATPSQSGGTAGSPSTAGNSTRPMGFLQRARSVVTRPPEPRTRPQSHMPAPPRANENPETAPSIPINRGHRRARSDQAQTDLGAAVVVQQMNRGSPLRAVSGGPLSPGISPLNRAQTSYFMPTSTTTAARTPSQSGTGTTGQTSSRNSVVSDQSLERESTDASSVQLSSQSREQTVLPAGVMKQNQLRPLRLVQEQTNADEEAQKRANRGSWMGWFKQGSVEASNQ